MNGYEPSLLNASLPYFSAYYVFDIFKTLEECSARFVFGDKIDDKNINSVRSYLLHKGLIQELNHNSPFVILTARGRKLKEIGDLDKFIKWDVYETEYPDRLKKQEHYLFVIAIAVCAGTMASGAKDLSEMVSKYLLHSVEWKASLLLLFFGIGIGTAISPIISELVWRNKK